MTIMVERTPEERAAFRAEVLARQSARAIGETTPSQGDKGFVTDGDREISGANLPLSASSSDVAP
jgi:hypothetical protein